MEGSNIILGLDRWRSIELAVVAVVVSLSGILLSWISHLTFTRRRTLHLPPGPKGWPLVGAIPYLGFYVHRSFYKLCNKYGPIMYLKLGSVSTLVISNAELAKEVLQTNDQLFASRPPMLVPVLLTYGAQDIAFAPYGPHWRQARRIAHSELLTPSKVAHFMSIQKNEILKTIHMVLEESQVGGKANAAVNMTVLLNGMAMNIFTKMMWNRRHRNLKGTESQKDQRFEELIKGIDAVSRTINVADFLPTPLKSFAMMVSGLERRAKGLHDELDRFCETIVSDRERDLANLTESEAAANDFLNTMLNTQNEAGNSLGLSRESMKAILAEIIMAGTDTTTLILDWAFAELLKHPKIMKRLQDELRNVVGEDRLVSELDIPNLKFLDAVMKEVLRVHTLGPLGVPHFSMADCKVGGYDVPKNTIVFINMFALHRDPAVWENPWEFNPDRFLNSNMDCRGQNFQFLPFGSGRRMCLGINFALSFMRLAVAQMFHTAEWSLPEGQTADDLDMSETPGLILGRATPLHLRAKPRLASHIIYPTLD